MTVPSYWEREDYLRSFLKVFMISTLGLVLSGCHSDTPHSPTKHVTASAAQPKSQATIEDIAGSAKQDEHQHTYVCPPNKIMTGRHHTGDEEGPTYYFCGTATQGGPLTVKQETWEGPYNEYDGYKFECQENQVMTGREHWGDERTSQTHYGCGSIKGPLGDIYVIKDLAWHHIDQEKNSIFDCPTNKVLVGRGHEDDENGPTEYLCGTLW